jgi:trehalose synthase
MAGDRLLRQMEPERHRSLAEYEAVAHLAQAVRELRSEAELVLPRLAGRTIWMVSSTAQGVGLPRCS